MVSTQPDHARALHLEGLYAFEDADACATHRHPIFFEFAPAMGPAHAHGWTCVPWLVQRQRDWTLET